MSNNVIDINELHQDQHNFNKGTERGQELMEKSFKEFGAGRSILVDKDGNIIAGNKSQKAAIAAGIKKVRVIETDGSELIAVKRTDIDIDSAEGRKLALADNLTQQVNLSWDEVELKDVSAELESFDINDFKASDFLPSIEETEEQAIERKKREFEEKMANGEIQEDDPEYLEFLDKFKEKKTTDDCYTPELVYEAVANWVANEYNVSRSKFKRPFYPGGDYQHEKYGADDIVVDNPPFSIMSEIVSFYAERKIRFFLFGPHLTLFNQSTDKFCTCLPIGVPITYANGANVNTSFITNIEPSNIRFRSEPRLYKLVKEANEETQKQTNKELPVYSYDKHIICTPLLSQFSRFGIDFVVTKEESEIVSQLDSQKESGKAIFGKGYLISDRLLAEREKAEREKAEREKVYKWDLSEREKQIVARLSANV